MITLHEIKTALSGLTVENGDCSSEHIDAAITSLQTALEALNTVSVRGRTNVDTLLGCMMAIEMMIGEATDG